MEWVINVSLGEIFLKGKNRKTFVKRAIRQIKNGTKDLDIKDIYFEQGKVYLLCDKELIEDVIERLQMIFGLDVIYPALRVEKNMEDISKGVLEILKDKNDKEYTFKIEGKRTDKSFHLTSPELSRELGGVVLRNKDNFKVNVKNPEIEVLVEVRDYGYISIEKREGAGGLPLGSSGRGLLLLSGGIDSPVAGYKRGHRGMDIDCLYFNSFPFTSKRAEDKAIRLAKSLSTYLGDIRYYSVNLLESYNEIKKNCKEKFTTVLARRMMMRIAERISEENEYQALITGESLGQVASQTVESMHVVDDSTNMLILRPLVTMDKKEIIDIAEKIGTYDISIEPHLDCCSFFAPDRPVTKPRLNDILREEEKLDIDKLVDNALEKMEIIEIKLDRMGE